MTSVCRLPGPVADLWDWQFDGSCRRANPDVFFHPDGERGSSRRSRDRAAKAVCLDCPVLQDCRKHALQVREPYGVWGGMTEYEREAMHVASTGPRTASLSHASLELCRDKGSAASPESRADQGAIHRYRPTELEGDR
jgi:WhiB family transcriptional regulator, redox-sensing transcriptional regulator